MTQKYKITFLIAAHNEEKMIPIALNRLLEVYKDYPNTEVLIGLDGCTDKTLEIVKQFAKKSKIFIFFELNERNGKQAVIEKLEPHITGDIVIIHDADWSFLYKSKKELIDFLKLFDNPEIGGIADSIDCEMSKPNFYKITSLGFLASAWGNHLLTSYYKKKFTKEENGIKVYDTENMKFCPWLDVYRKKAMDKTKHKNELRAGDHIERTLRLINAGYKIASFDNENWPHFNVIYNEQSIKGLIKQKTRGIISKSKIQSAYSFEIPFFGFYVPFLLYILKESFKVKRIRDFTAIYIYLAIIIYSTILAKINQNFSVKDVWKLRIERQ